MGYQVIRQPAGQLAIFSSYTDTIVMWDATPEDITEFFVDLCGLDGCERLHYAAGYCNAHWACRWCLQSKLILARYGITVDRYRELLDAQGGGCAICRGVNASGRLLAVDHDHACCPGDKACGKCVRGLLCSNCNMAIGLFKEDAVRMRAALVYLDRP